MYFSYDGFIFRLLPLYFQKNSGMGVWCS